MLRYSDDEQEQPGSTTTNGWANGNGAVKSEDVEMSDDDDDVPLVCLSHNSCIGGPVNLCSRPCVWLLLSSHIVTINPQRRHVVSSSS